MRRFMLAFACLAVLFATAPAMAAVCTTGTPNCPNTVCTQLGTTQLSADKASIISCVLNNGNTNNSVTECATGGGCTWKRMSGGSDYGNLTVCSLNTAYLAQTNTIVMSACRRSGSSNWLSGEINGSTVQWESIQDNDTRSITMMVPKGSTWKVKLVTPSNTPSTCQNEAWMKACVYIPVD